MSTAGSDPESIIAKMAQIHAAALAPADPSSQDRAVAAAASAIAEQARETIRDQERNERTEAAQAAKEQAAKEQTSPETEESDNAIEPALDLLGSVDPKTVNALAAYEASMQRPYLSGLNLVG
jgi:DNA invertase Pin-like site-specific DNA recombinase